MLVMPCAWDQPDNAERVVRLGISRTIPRHRYTPGRVVAELRRLLDDPAYQRRASEVGEKVRQEDGVRVACDALGEVLQAGGPLPGCGRPDETPHQTGRAMDGPSGTASPSA